MGKKGNIHINSGGGPVFTDKVDNRKGQISGRSDKYSEGLRVDEVSKLFDNLLTRIEQHSNLSESAKADAKTDIQEIRQELAKKEQANENFLMRRFRNIARIAPDILELTLATIVHPALGLGVFAKKLAEKARTAT